MNDGRFFGASGGGSIDPRVRRLDSVLACGARGWGAPAIDRREADAMVAALKPPKRQRPLIAIIGINDATETTDYLMPYGILRRADVADVMTLATEPGR